VLGWTHSCHTGPLACGQCPGCIKHSNLMEELDWNR
jgi:7-cyano-7-deazaguanine synthase